MPRTSTSMNMPTSGACRRIPFRALQRPRHELAPHAGKIAHAPFGFGRIGERDNRRFLNEARQSKQHAHGERLGVRDQLRAGR